ncbi:hypothetical protein [Methylomonas sp. DH-1]|uniref:hypothetical protein n=1 Tax=Methylomonas sp. (strain DH-1) TaxID=1727196 RepID=UPI0007C942DB|nr:hypothetical protein [Methylomonas sp. DH-1]ANE54436.1 hypothetical protein AYM39_04020 [Methylomonas sp. DH-1]
MVFHQPAKAIKKKTKDKYVPVKEFFYNYMKENPDAPIEESRRLAVKARLTIKNSGFRKMPTDKTLRDHLKYPEE